MFGGKGFSNPLGDDILNTFIQDAAKKSRPDRSAPLNESDEKHLLATKKLVQQMAEEEESLSKKAPVVKTTSSLAQSNVIKKKPTETKKSNEGIDDLLNFMDDVKNDKLGTKKLPEPQKEFKPLSKTSVQDTPKFTGTNKFSEELDDEDLDIPAYDPTARDTTNKRPTVSSNDLAKKKSALFGLSSSAVANMNKTQTNDTQNTPSSVKPVQRPQTMESKPTDMDDDIGEINIGFSRRKGKSAATKERPATSSGDMKPQETKASGFEKLSLASKHEEESHGKEEDEDVESDYLSAVLSRGAKKDKNTGIAKLGESAKSGFGKMGILSLPTETAKTPTSDFTVSKEGFYKEGVGIEDRKEGSGLVKSPVGILGKKELQDPHGQNPLQAKSVVSIGGHGVRKERADGFGSRLENLQGSAVSGWEGSIREGLTASNEAVPKDAITYGHLKETEEYYKRRAKETEEYYENRYKKLKEALEEEKMKWEEIHEKELKLLRKENEDLRENMNKHLERERERMREVMALEMESKEKIHRYELQRQRRMFEEENDSLKRQFEAQAKLNNLADEIKISSKKLSSISDKMEQGTGTVVFGAKGDLREKERHLEEMERKLRHEMEIINDEKKRLDKIRMEIENKDSGEKQSIEKERELLRQEYNRLNILQESIRKQEAEKSRSLEKERLTYEIERSKLEKEEMALKDEYNRKYHELEVQAELLDRKKREFEKVLDQTETKFLQKKEELERTTKRLAAIEMDLMGRVKELEYKEMLVSKSADEVQKRLDLLELDRITFEKERGHMLKLADETRKDNEALRKFRQDFETEKEQNMRLKGDLAVFASNLRKERNKLTEEKTSLNMLHKTLEGIRHDYIKEMELGYPKPVEATTTRSMYPKENSRESSPGKTAYEFTTPKSPNWEYSSKGPGKENMNNRFPSLQVVISPNPASDRYVRLKDLKKDPREINDRKIMQQIKEVVEERRPEEVKKPKKESKKEVKIEDPDEWMKDFSPKGKGGMGNTFNYRSYMAQLKEIDKVSNRNQGYVVTEEEELKQTKMETNLLSSPKMYFSSDMNRRLRNMTDFS